MGYTDDVQKEQALQEAFNELLDQVIQVAIDLKGPSYAREYLLGEIHFRLPRQAVRPPYSKIPIPYEIRKAVLERDQYRCQSCSTWIDLTVDHIIPERHGGSATLENLRTLCRPCNARKGTKAGG